jgi:DNA segregation ATPase FtsK/SpoIIIE, S-DNA-T family
VVCPVAGHPCADPAGATGAGKASIIWGLIRALLPAMAAGLVRAHAADPKLMELAFGKVLHSASR